MSFTGPLQVERQAGGRWKLLADLVFNSAEVGAVTVPAGYVTDFASVPRLPLMYWLAGDTAHEAAVVHDWLYSEQKVSRDVADRVFREASAASGVAWWRRWLMWAGVRIGGGFAWGDK